MKNKNEIKCPECQKTYSQFFWHYEVKNGFVGDQYAIKNEECPFCKASKIEKDFLAS